MPSWISQYPAWYLQECSLLRQHYPDFQIDENGLDRGELIVRGELKVRPAGGVKRHPVLVVYHVATPFELPLVYPIRKMEKSDTDIVIEFFDRRHQMPSGNLCLFQRVTRTPTSDNCIDIAQVLRRAEQWFMGYYTGRWPPDTAESELEAYFQHASDVLLAECFHDPAVTGHGRFYMIPDLRRVADASPDCAGHPMIVTGMTVEAGIIRTIDPRSELAPLYPWISNNEWNPYQAAAQANQASHGLARMEEGHWWTLPKEPDPFRDGKGLLATLNALDSNGDAWRIVEEALGRELESIGPYYFALQYPARSGGIEWLFLMATPPSPPRTGSVPTIRTTQEKRNEFEARRIACLRVHSIRAADMWRRNEGVLKPSIRDKTVALIGLGALGSRVAELLAQAGVHRFALCDCDHLKPMNVARHVGGIIDFGASKIRVVNTRLRGINPRVQFNSSLANATGVPHLLARFMHDADLVISTTADEQVESVINNIAVTTGRAVLYGRALRQASMGRVFLVRPGRDACKECLSTYRQLATTNPSSDWIDISEDASGAIFHECGRPVIAGSAADLSFVATLIARVAIDFLEDPAKDVNHWIWSRSAAPDIDARLTKPLSTFCGTISPSAACVVCREPPISRIVLADEAKADILAQTVASPDAETGGLLIGFVDETNQAIVTRATGPGPNAKRSPTRFERDVTFAQGELDRAFQELGKSGLYLGEWHSHLEPYPEPSATDVSSLCGIAASPNYLTANPILLISGFDPSKKRIISSPSWVFAATGRFYSIPNSSLT